MHVPNWESIAGSFGRKTNTVTSLRPLENFVVCSACVHRRSICSFDFLFCKFAKSSDSFLCNVQTHVFISVLVFAVVLTKAACRACGQFPYTQETVISSAVARRATRE